MMNWKTPKERDPFYEQRLNDALSRKLPLAYFCYVEALGRDPEDADLYKAGAAIYVRYRQVIQKHDALSVEIDQKDKELHKAREDEKRKRGAFKSKTPQEVKRLIDACPRVLRNKTTTELSMFIKTYAPSKFNPRTAFDLDALWGQAKGICKTYKPKWDAWDESNKRLRTLLKNKTGLEEIRDSKYKDAKAYKEELDAFERPGG